jgi:hypothetical protein
MALCQERQPVNRQEAEEYLGVAKPAKPAKVRQSYPMINRETPSHWRKTLKLWCIVVLIYIGLSMLGGVVAGIIERVWP